MNANERGTVPRSFSQTYSSPASLVGAGDEVFGKELFSFCNSVAKIWRLRQKVLFLPPNHLDMEEKRYSIHEEENEMVSEPAIASAMAHRQPFNEAQFDLLRMMSYVKTPTALEDLRQVISDYFAKKVEEEVDKLWADGTLNAEKVESFRHLHERTPYRK